MIKTLAKFFLLSYNYLKFNEGFRKTLLKQPIKKDLSLLFGEKEAFYMKKFNTKTLARAGIIAALYVALSVLVLPLASGSIQIRFGEAMTILPLFFPEACIALFVGCILVNFISGCVLIEVALGSLITLFSALLTYVVGKKIKSKWLKIFIGGLFPVILNALLLPLVWYWCYGNIEYVYLLQALLIFVGQAVAVYGLGFIVYLYLEKLLSKNVNFIK